MKQQKFFSSIIILLFTACTSNEIASSKDVNPQTIYIHYSINGSEGDSNILCIAQYRFGGENGTTLLLSPPGNISLDDKNLSADSSIFYGARYTLYKNTETFSGVHQWQYTDINGKKLTERFIFQPVCFKNTFPQVLHKKDTALALSGIADGDTLLIEITDTSSAHGELIFQTAVKNGAISLSGKDLKTLSNGPITFKIYQNKNTPLQNPTQQGGFMELHYSLKQRYCQLED